MADDFFLVAHDSISWKCQLSERVLDIGLAAALLGEQVLFLRLNLRGGRLGLVNETPPQTLDELTQTVFAHLCRHRDVTSVREWLRWLSAHSYDKVVERLVREQLLYPAKERRGLRKATVYRPTTATPLGAAEG
ncbi:GPP34 family phosphoprotein, partial [Actinophytocola sp.]|uniref:GPP34 family phosphoprotein n=1 Tax=Actinophytocola sp. TaxID=1872138 RepID=UPI00389AED7F